MILCLLILGSVLERTKGKRSSDSTTPWDHRSFWRDTGKFELPHVFELLSTQILLCFHLFLHWVSWILPTQEVLALFLNFFILQRSMNITLERLERVHNAGIEFMEAAKRVFPERNGKLNPDGSLIGWNIWKFHSILHKAMEILEYGWTENVSTQSGECAHKVYFHLFLHYFHLFLYSFITDSSLSLPAGLSRTSKRFRTARIWSKRWNVSWISTKDDN